MEKVVPGASADEYRLRNWLWDRALSGDILVEQNIHIIDLCNWMLGAHPLKATATGGRNILTHVGDCWDNYQVDFTYPNDVHFRFHPRSSAATGSSTRACGCSAANGAATVPYSGPVQIMGAQPWAWQDSMNDCSRVRGSSRPTAAFEDNLAFADRDKERTFIDEHRLRPAPQPDRRRRGDRVELHAGAHGRACADREVTWENLLAHGETYKLGMNLAQFG